MSPTPSSAGFRMPAEWERHRATWIGWPHNLTDWPGKFTPIPWVYAEIVRGISAGETVRILVEDADHEAKARRTLERAGVEGIGERVDFVRIHTNRGWTRDFGPIFVKKPGEIAVVNFRFNAWAKYKDWQKDDLVAEQAAKRLGVKLFEGKIEGHGAGAEGSDASSSSEKSAPRERQFVLEGGAIDVNGRGTVITTEECLLDPKVQTRNPGLSREGTDAALRELIGAGNVLWLGKGIAGDDTHGHVDDLCRFVGPRTVVLCREPSPADANYHVLEENYERLQGMKVEDGSSIEVIDLPMPAPVVFEGRRLPASYANFYIANAAVLVPTFNDPNDRIALGILAELFPDRPIQGIHAVDLVWGLGTLHCLTQQEPAP